MKRWLRFRNTDERLVGSVTPTEDVRRELDAHIALRTQDLIAEGWDPNAARAEAQRRFGDVADVSRDCVTIAKRQHRSARRIRWLEAFLGDLRFGVRQLRRDPGFTVVAVLTLGLGIGAATAIFTVVDGVLLRPLPFESPDRVYVLREIDGEGRVLQVSAPNFLDWRERNRSFDQLAFSQFWGSRTILGADEPTRAVVERTSANFFQVFATSPWLGRTFAPADASTPVAVVGYDFWRDALSADSNIAGRALTMLNGTYQVIGVMPPGFTYQGDSDVWIPVDPRTMGASRTSHSLRVAGRLREGIVADDAQRDMNAVAVAVREDEPRSSAVAVRFDAFADTVVGDTRRPLTLLAASAGMLVLIACANLASTLLARGTHREREFAVRASLGAERARLVRQLLTEGFLLALFGGALGLVLAIAGTAIMLQGVTLPHAERIGIDARVIGFTLALSTGTAILFGLAPAMRSSFVAPGQVLRGGVRGGSERRLGVWQVLVAGEVALAVVLLIGSGLLIRSFRAVLDVHPGFDIQGVLTVEVSLPEARYELGPPVTAFHDRVIEELSAVPGVTAVGTINHLPLAGRSMFAGLELVGRTEPGRGDYRVASSEYFNAMGIPIVEGRAFRPSDDESAGHVLIVNQTLARQLWPNESAVGQRVRISGNDRHFRTWLTVIGVSGDIRHRSLVTEDRPTYYVHLRQRPDQTRNAVVAVRTAQAPETLVSTVRARIAAVDPDVPTVFATMQDRVARSVADRQFTVSVLTTFAVLAVTLAAIGIYGVVSYTVARRNREMGIRLALGARPGAVGTLVVRQSMTTVAAGLVVGAAAAILSGRFVQTLLFEIEPLDFQTFVTVLVVLTAVAVAASAIPALRTTRIDPISTIRSE